VVFEKQQKKKPALTRNDPATGQKRPPGKAPCEKRTEPSEVGSGGKGGESGVFVDKKNDVRVLSTSVGN